jgi:hypothetical protein
MGEKGDVYSVLVRKPEGNRPLGIPRSRWEDNIKTEQSFFYSESDANVNFLKNNIKIYIKRAPTCFGAVTPSSGSALLVLVKVTVVKIVN